MQTVSSIIKLSTEYLEKKGDKRPRYSAEVLLAHLLKCKRLDLYLDFDRPLEPDELDEMRSLVKKRAEGVPVEYIQGEVEFGGNRLKVSPDVLIPRPETELLLERANKVVKEGMEVWDICCGSGCLGLGVKKAHPEASVTLSDIDPKALAVARENGSSMDVAFLEGDLFAPFEGRRADVILSNPPYLASHELDNAHEPEIALVAGASGLEFYERIADEVEAHLNSGGTLFLEIGTGQGDAVLALFAKSRWERECELDWAGHDRFVTLRRKDQSTDS